METFLIKAVQFILSLSILILLHELGHFSFARLFKVRVEKFYMFFNPKFSIFRAKKINGKWQYKFFSKNVPSNLREKVNAEGEKILDKKGKVTYEIIPTEEFDQNDWRKYPDATEWGFGWLPLGGYCSIAGMVDETKSLSQLPSEPQRWEYRSRTVWQRLPIITGGVLVNFILALLIFSATLFIWGEEYVPLSNAKYGMQFSKTLQNAGFQNGDKIINIDGKTIKTEGEFSEKVILDKSKSILVNRNGKQIEIALPADVSVKILGANETSIATMRFPFIIENVAVGTPAEKANLQKGDSVVGINGQQMFAFQDISEELSQSKGKTVKLDFIRNGVTEHKTILLDETGKLGVGIKTQFNDMPSVTKKYGFFESIPAGTSKGMKVLTKYIKGMKFLATKEGAKQLGGFGTLGKLFPSTWDWQAFWMLTAFLSIILAFMNFLPIPALDGGYVLFILYEIITGKKPNDKFLEHAQTIGFFFLFALLIYANANDIFKALFHH